LLCGPPNLRRNVGAEPYIESVFENDLVELDAAGTLAAAEDNEHALTTAEIRRLQIAAHWADLHPGDAITQSRIPGTEHPIRLGGDGTPTIADFCPAELGCVLRISDGSAAKLIGDALDLRHRLPKIWTAALAGQAPAYQARHIAAATRHLTKDQAGFVDARLAPSLGALSWNRLHTLVEAAIYEADPAGADQRATQAAQERFVRLGRSSEHGLKMIIARATAGDAIWFKATIDRIADILTRQGDDDPVEIRRSKAIGILAQPAQALQLLCQHQNDDSDGPEEPPDLAEEPDLAEQSDLAEEPAQDDHDGDDVACPEDADMAGNTGLADNDCPISDPQTAPPAPPVAAHQAVTVSPGPGTAACRGVCPSQRRSPQRRHRCGPGRTGRSGAIEPATHDPRRPLQHQCETDISVDSYEIPASLREQILLRNPADVFPYAAAVSRSIDIDHTIPYLNPDKGGPPGQTRIGNLGPQLRRHHNYKTHGGWQVGQPEPATWLWRAPHGRIYLVNTTGTHPLGDSQFAQAIWRAVDSCHPFASQLGQSSGLPS
jgi:Domain of unknown function (DUF222)